MIRAKVAAGTLMIVIGLALFGIRMSILRGPNATYGMFEDGDLERSATGLFFVIAGALILLTARRR
jgi:hypothetical protein